MSGGGGGGVAAAVAAREGSVQGRAGRGVRGLVQLFDLGWGRSCAPAATSSSSFSSKTWRCLDSVPRQSSGQSCYAETFPYSANCAEDRGFLPRCRSWTRLLTARCCAVLVMVQTAQLCAVLDKVVDLPVIVQAQGMVQSTVVQFFHKVVACPLLRRQVYGSAVLGQGCLRARCVQRQCWGPDVQKIVVFHCCSFRQGGPCSFLSVARRCRRNISCCCGRPCDHAETVLSLTLKGALRFSSSRSLRTFQLCNRDGYSVMHWVAVYGRLWRR